VLYGGHVSVDEELDILAEHIPIAKGMYLLHRITQDRNSVRRVDPRRAGYTIDTPVPYMLQDLINLIDERMGKLENRATRMHYHRLLARIETLRSDGRFRLHVRERQCRRRPRWAKSSPICSAWSRTASR